MKSAIPVEKSTEIPELTTLSLAAEEESENTQASDSAAMTTLEQSISAVDVTPETTRSDGAPKTEFSSSMAPKSESTSTTNMIKPTAKTTLKPQAF